MKRRIINIDEEKCNGCGLCVKACHEGAIGLVNGKAKLMRDDYCDGLGDCLPECPTGAITFVEREAAAYDEQAVLENKRKKGIEAQGGCPGSRLREFNAARKKETVTATAHTDGKPVSQLRQWPVQIKLLPTNTKIFDGAKLLVAADCTAYAYANFHEDFIKNHVVLVGCPKLDSIDYSEKLAEIIRTNDIKSIHVVRMEVPCCGGMAFAVKQAIQKSGKLIPWRVTIISPEGQIVEED